jgi:hypothetical protein
MKPMFNKCLKAVYAAMFIYLLSCAPSCLPNIPALSIISFSMPAAYAAVPNAINYQGR